MSADPPLFTANVSNLCEFIQSWKKPYTYSTYTYYCNYSKINEYSIFLFVKLDLKGHISSYF
jgi:hypothetical protein